jgi:23S rRNA pseudouridine1911/1915/1917 synthase
MIIEWSNDWVLYNDNHLIAVNKPAGLLVQGDDTGDIALLDMVKAYIKRKEKKPGNVFIGTIHRLDRPVSGVVLFAKTSKALTRMSEMFKEKQIRKTYFALVENRPKKLNSTLEHWLTKDTDKNLAHAHDKEVKNSKNAVLEYFYIGTANHLYLLRVNPLTGRPHQIRVQLAKIGCSIAGDLKYGAKSSHGHKIFLHSGKVNFVNPVKKEAMEITCLPPNEGNWQFFQELITNN